MLRRPNSAASVAILPNDVMLEIVSWLPVKHVMQLRCLNKFFKTLTFDPHFVRMHLNKSSRNSQLALTYYEDNSPKTSLVTLSIPHILQNQFTTFYPFDRYYFRVDEFLGGMRRRVVASCDGLLLVVMPCGWISFWNPAKRTKSENFNIFPGFGSFFYLPKCLKFSFGYDNSTRTNKVVVFYKDEKMYGCNPKCVVKVFSLGDNSWRDIQCFPVLPLYWFQPDNNNGVHLNGTINWLALRDYFSRDYIFCSKDSGVTVDQYVIVSLDLSTEIYTQLSLPQGFDKVPCYQPKVVVLMDCLCFCHDFEETHFVIWQMKDFGVQDSWIQLFKISNFFEQVNFLPLYLSKNGDTLILANDHHNIEAFIYSYGDNKVEKIEISHCILWSHAKNYVESLVSTH